MGSGRRTSVYVHRGETAYPRMTVGGPLSPHLPIRAREWHIRLPLGAVGPLALLGTFSAWRGQYQATTLKVEVRRSAASTRQEEIRMVGNALKDVNIHGILHFAEILMIR